VVPAKL
jgi:hypothetical protein